MPGPDWIAQVENACEHRGLQVTALRRNVIDILAGSDQPLGAYAIIQKLSEAQKRPVAPPTVYRTLDFLLENGFVVKIESRQAFAACDHLGHGHDHHGMMFSCSSCGRAVEIDMPAVDREVAAAAERLHFRIARKVFEVEGRCDKCSGASA